MTNFKCNNCFLIIEGSLVTWDVSKPGIQLPHCPMCGARVEPMCEHDHPCRCMHDISDGARVCPICKEFTCACGAHDCIVVSRITGLEVKVAGLTFTEICPMYADGIVVKDRNFSTVIELIFHDKKSDKTDR
jgi:hypothetical protein